MRPLRLKARRYTIQWLHIHTIWTVSRRHISTIHVFSLFEFCHTELHFSITNVSNSESIIFALCGRIVIPLWKNMRSTGADVADVHRSLLNNGRSRLYCLEVAAVCMVRVASLNYGLWPMEKVHR